MNKNAEEQFTMSNDKLNQASFEEDKEQERYEREMLDQLSKVFVEGG